MSRIVVFVLLLGLTAQAEMRFLNNTDQSLKVESFDAQGRLHSGLVAPGLILSDPVGAPAKPRSDEVLVIRSVAGELLYSDKRKAGYVYLLNPRGDRISVVELGRFQGSILGSPPRVLNASQKDLTLHFVYDDFSQEETRVDQPSSQQKLLPVVVGHPDKKVLETQIVAEGLSTTTLLQSGRVYLIQVKAGQLEAEVVAIN